MLRMSGALPVMLFIPSMQISRVFALVFAEQPLEVVGVLVLEALDRRAANRRELAALVDRLVRAPVDEDRPAGGEHGDHGKVDERDRRQHECVLGAEQLRKPRLRSPRRARGCPSRRDQLGCVPQRSRYSGTRFDDLALEVEAEVVTGGEVGEPLLADADPAGRRSLR